jgi:hypothetical protein
LAKYIKPMWKLRMLNIDVLNLSLYALYSKAEWIKSIFMPLLPEDETTHSRYLNVSTGLFLYKVLFASIIHNFINICTKFQKNSP